MKNKLLLLALALGSLALAGCMSASRLNDMHIGMTKDQVVSLLGTPDSTSAQSNVEYLIYYLDTAGGRYGGYGTEPYMVRMVDGKVESFGRYRVLEDLYNRPITAARPGDPNFPQSFLLGSAPTFLPQGNSDLASQLTKLEALKNRGVLTDEEFQKAKEKLLAEQK